jgi:hypothetical protein
MPDTKQKFHLLADQFAVLEKNLRAAESAEQRAELLRKMNALIVIEELDQLILANESSLDSNLASIAPTIGSCRAH